MIIPILSSTYHFIYFGNQGCQIGNTWTTCGPKLDGVSFSEILIKKCSNENHRTDCKLSIMIWTPI